MPTQTQSNRESDQDASQGRQVISPNDMLQRVETTTDTYYDVGTEQEEGTVRRIEGDEKLVIPLAEETFTVEKHESIKGVVRIHKTVTEHQETIDAPTYSESVNVERVSRGEWVDSIPQIRYEGETMIIPVIEEVLVVEKRLRLREELRVTKQRIEDTTPQQVTLRREEVTIDRQTMDGTTNE
jgi:uncharacterized protein (TIGR02271 family)